MLACCPVNPIFSAAMFLALRLAVQAFKREEESAKTLKRRRDRLEQVCTHSQLILTNVRIRTVACVA
jgi:hypothetical protein